MSVVANAGDVRLDEPVAPSIDVAPRRIRSRYLVGPAYDWAFFLTPPMVALAIGFAVSRWRSVHEPIVLAGVETTPSGFLLGMLIQAHLVAVIFRSHGNPSVFAAHRARFVAVPVVLFAAIVAVPWIAVASLTVATFWDVYHSGAQTFGFGRIYDRNAGATSEVGRRLDFVLNQLLYAGPILAGVSFSAHIGALEEFAELRDPLSTFLANVPAKALAHHEAIAWGVVASGGVFLVVYVAVYAHLARSGQVVSPLKVGLYVSTGACSIYVWAFDSWGEAFLVMNLFHAVQYLALVWATERERLAARFASAAGLARPAAGLVFFGAVFVYGAVVELLDPTFELAWAATMVVSLMHFWYDGFVWSVRANSV